MANTYEAELDIAMKAVHRASIVTKNVMNGIESLDKKDASPVTMADFAAQALIIHAIHQRYPDDRFVAEESADMLREDPKLLDQVWDLVESANRSVRGYSSQLPSPGNPEEMMEAIDLGSKGEPPSSGRVWILDPVDGTATFLKGQQYVVCLALTIDGKEQVGALGCPNLKPGNNQVEEDLVDKHGYGVLVSAVLGHGTNMSEMTEHGLGTMKPVLRSSVFSGVSDLQFTDSPKSSHAHLPSHHKVFQKLGLKKKNVNMWSMQIKYVALALGACDAVIRIPPDRSVRASVWDHAGGQLILTEAGGKVTDLDGQEFNFAKGRYFGVNWGFVAADRKVYDSVFQVVEQVLNDGH